MFMSALVCRIWLQVPLQELGRRLIQRSLYWLFQLPFYSNSYSQGAAVYNVSEVFVVNR